MPGIKTSVYWTNQGAISATMAGIAASSRLSGRGSNVIKGRIRQIIMDDNVDKLVNRSVDRYGKPFARLSPVTLKDPRRGPGPALVPNFMHSRFIQNFRAEWIKSSILGYATLEMRWINMPWAIYHITGSRDGKHPPRRDPSGITPKGWSQIRHAVTEWGKQLLRGKAQ